MEKRNILSGVCLMLVSLVTCAMAYQLGLGTGNNPGAGFAAFGIAFLLGLMSLGMFLKSLARLRAKNGKAEPVSPIMWRKPLLILIVLAGYGVFFNSLGFSLSTFLLMMLLIWVFGRQRLVLSLTVSILTVASSYALFVMALGLPFPVGSLWYLFGG